MTDIDILNYVFSESGKLMHTRLIDMPKDMIDYLRNRYTDSESLKESIYRLKYNIEIRPICPICGGRVKWLKSNKYNATCCKECANKLNYINRTSTCIRKYGVDNPAKSELIKHKISKANKSISAQSTAKRHQTCIEIYGVENCYQSSVLKEKIKTTCLEKYGVDNPAKCKEVQHKISNTCLQKYGVENYAQSEEYKKIVSSEDFQRRRREHEYITKKKNNSFNISKTEAESFVLIKAKYPDVIAQYKSDSYPFNCDFYIPSLDLYIECNYHWTHGGKPYNEDTCKEQLELWKNKHSQFYNNAIETWTIRDVIKRQTAQERNLYFIEFWNIDELKEWLNINN